MGNIVVRLGYPEAAEELIRAAWAYANAIDHRPLRGKLRALLSNITYWSGRFEQSRDLAADGLRYVPDGAPGADLHVLYARAAARLGDLDAARQAVTDAHDAQERDYADDLTEIGGEFVVSRPTNFGCAGTALASIRGAEREAAGELEQAIVLYDEGPKRGETHMFYGKPLAGIDLAIVRLRSGALDAAVAAVEPALSLPLPQRIAQVTTRLAEARKELAAPVFRGSAQARDLGARIEDFDRETIVAGLHSLPGGPG
jgi:tetratricopeptide (TPR) repeat protein